MPKPSLQRGWLAATLSTFVAIACPPTIAAEAESVSPLVDTDVLGAGLRVPDPMTPRLLAQRVDDKAKPEPKSRADALLGDDNLEDTPTPATKLFGFYQFEGAYTLPKPAHWSKLMNRFDVGAQGAFSENVKWKIEGRVDYDAIYSLSNFYPSAVRDNRRFDAMFRETYVDIGAGNFEFRLGSQQIIWGEVVGLFFADVVSAKDLRETILTDFDVLRIPQWAARAEYFKNDFHLEAIWIPVPTVDRIGKPGGAFYPYPPPIAGYVPAFNAEQHPERNGANMNYGLRASLLKSGWDVAGFAYRSVDANATFTREVVAGPVPTLLYTPRHDKITQYGLTASKDMNNFVFKTEAVYTVGRNFNVTRLSDSDGVVRQNYLDYIVSLEFPLPEDARVNLQFFQRRFSDHDPDIIPKTVESGVTLFLSAKLTPRLEPQVLLIHSLNRSDWLLRPKLVWNVDKTWRAIAGADIFGGPATGLFGQYNKQDRVYVEMRRSF